MGPRVGEADFTYVSTRDVLRIVNQCSSTITQIGCASRVWRVSWVSNVDRDEPYTKLGCEGGYASGGR